MLEKRRRAEYRLPPHRSFARLAVTPLHRKNSASPRLCVVKKCNTICGRFSKIRRHVQEREGSQNENGTESTAEESNGQLVCQAGPLKHHARKKHDGPEDLEPDDDLDQTKREVPEFLL
jgi:hypothetical protein